MKLKARLRLGRVPFEPVNIWADPAAAAVVRTANDGDELVPTARADRRHRRPLPEQSERRGGACRARRRGVSHGLGPPIRISLPSGR